MLLGALIIAHWITVAWSGITVTIKRNIFTAFYFHKLFELVKLSKIEWLKKFLVLQYFTLFLFKSDIDIYFRQKNKSNCN